MTPLRTLVASITLTAIVASATGATAGQSTERSGAPRLRAALISNEPADYQPVTPATILDTTKGIGAPKALVVGGRTITLNVAGIGGIPSSGVDSVVLNVKTSYASVSSQVVVWPAGATRPSPTTVEAIVNRNESTLMVAQLGTNGAVSLRNSKGRIHLQADVLGWFPTDSGMSVLPAAALLDTKSGVGAAIGKIGAGATKVVAVAGIAGIPSAGGGTLVANVRASGASVATDVTLWPTGDAQSAVANVALKPGMSERNLAFIPVAPDGTISVHNLAGTVDVTIDAMAWLPSTSGYTPVVPTRVLDTLAGIGGSVAKLGPARSRTVTVGGIASIPTSGITAAVVNIAALNSTALTDITAWTTGTTRPQTPLLRVNTGELEQNHVVVPLDATGKFSIYNKLGKLDVRADVVGYFAPPSDGTWRFVPDTLTLTATNQLQTAQLTKFASDGSIIATTPPSGVTRSVIGDSGVATIVDRTDGSTEVTATATIGSQFGVYQIPGQVAPVPLSIMNVRLAPGVLVVPNNDIFFPPVNLPDGVDPLTAGLPGISPSAIGPFSLAEITDRIALNEDPDISGGATTVTTLIPWVIRGVAPVTGTVLLGAGGNNIFGEVVEPAGFPTVQRGAFSLIIVATVDFFDIYEQVHFDITSDDFSAFGFAPGATSMASLPAGGEASPKTTSFDAAIKNSIGSTRNANSSAPATAATANPCLPALSASLGSVSITPPNLILLPVFEPVVSSDAAGNTQIDLRLGFSLTASAGVSGTVQLAGTVSGTCDLAALARLNIPATFLGPLAGLLDFFVKSDLKLDYNLTVAGGPKAEIGASCSITQRATFGFSYNSGSGFSVLPNETPQPTAPCTTVARATGLTTNAATIDATLFVYAEFPLGIKFGGRVLGYLGSLVGRADAGDLEFASFKVGPQAHIAWHSDQQVLFAKDTGSTVALEFAANASLSVPVLESLAKRFTGGLFVFPSITLQLPTITLGALYKAVEPQSNTNVEVYINGTPQLNSAGGDIIKVATGDLLSISAPMQSKSVAIAPEPTVAGGAAWIESGSSYVEFPSLPIQTSSPSAGSVINNLSGSATIDQTICDEIGTTAKEIRLLANAPMFSLPTAGYAGGFKILCEAPKLEWAGSSLDLGVSLGSLSETVGLKPSHLRLSQWDLVHDSHWPTWLTASPNTGSFDAEESTVQVTFTANCSKVVPRAKVSYTVRARTLSALIDPAATADLPITADCRPEYIEFNPNKLNGTGHASLDTFGKSVGRWDFTAASLSAAPKWLHVGGSKSNPIAISPLTGVYGAGNHSVSVGFTVANRASTCQLQAARSYDLIVNTTHISGPQEDRGKATIKVSQPLVPSDASKCVDGKSAQSHGDPHLVSFDGVNFDAQVLGEYVAFAPTAGNTGPTLQVRHENWSGASTSAFAPTLTTAFAVHTDGHTIEVYVRPNPEVRIDGAVVALADGVPTSIDDDLSITFVGRSSQYFGSWLAVDIDGSELRVRSALFSNEYLNVHATVANGTPVAGLYGTPDGNAANDLTSKSGTPYTQSAIHLHETDLYALTDSWRITDLADSFFSATYPGFADANPPLNTGVLLDPFRAQIIAQLGNITAVCDAGGGASAATITALAMELAIGRPINQATSYSCRYEIRGHVQAPGSGPVSGLEITLDAIGLAPCNTTTGVGGDYACTLTPDLAEITSGTPATPLTVTAEARWRGLPAIIATGTHDFTALAGLQGSAPIGLIDFDIDPNSLPRLVVSGNLIDNNGPVTAATSIDITAYDAANNYVAGIRDVLIPDANGDYTLTRVLPHGATRADLVFQVGPQIDWVTHPVTNLVDGPNSFTFDIDHRVPRLDIGGTMTGIGGAPLGPVYVRYQVYDANDNPVSSGYQYAEPHPVDGAYAFGLDLPQLATRAVITPQVGYAIDYQPTTIEPLAKGSNVRIINVDYQPKSITLSGVVTTYGQPFQVVVPTNFKIFDVNNNVISYGGRQPMNNSHLTAGAYSYTETLPLAANRIEVEAQVTFSQGDYYFAELTSLQPGNNPLTLSFDHSPAKVTVSGTALTNGVPTTSNVFFSFTQYDVHNAMIGGGASINATAPNASTGAYSKTLTMTAKTTRVAIEAYLEIDPAQKVTVPDIIGMVTNGTYSATANLDISVFEATVHGVISSLGVPIADTNPAAVLNFFALDENNNFVAGSSRSHEVLTGAGGTYSLTLRNLPAASRVVYVYTTLNTPAGDVTIQDSFAVTPLGVNDFTFSPDTAVVTLDGTALNNGVPITDLSGGSDSEGLTFIVSTTNVYGGTDSFSRDANYDESTGEFSFSVPIQAGTSVRFCTDETFAVQCTANESFPAGTHTRRLDFDVDPTTTLVQLDLTVTEAGAPYTDDSEIEVIGYTFDPNNFAQDPPYTRGGANTQIVDDSNGRYLLDVPVLASSRFVTVSVRPVGGGTPYVRTFERISGNPDTFTFEIDLQAAWFQQHVGLHTIAPCLPATVTRKVTIWEVPDGTTGQDYDIDDRTWPNGTNLGSYAVVPDPFTGEYDLSVQLPPGTEAVAEVIENPSYYPANFIGQPLGVRVWDATADQTLDFGLGEQVQCPTVTPIYIDLAGTVTDAGAPIADDQVAVEMYAYNFDPNLFAQNPPYNESTSARQFSPMTSNGVWNITTLVPDTTTFITLKVTPSGQDPFVRTFVRTLGQADLFTFDIDIAAPWLDAHGNLQTETPCTTNTAVREVTLWALPSDAHPDYDFPNDTWPTGTNLGTYTVVPNPFTGNYDLSVQLPAGTEAVGWLEGSSSLYDPGHFNTGYVTAIDVIQGQRRNHSPNDTIPCPV